MDKNFSIKTVLKSYLFAGMVEKDVRHLLSCLKARVVSYEKGESLISLGEKLKVIGIVLDGEARVIYEDFWGNKIIFSELGVSSVFGEVFAVLGRDSEVRVVASSKVRVLWLDVFGLIRVCHHACGYHNQLIQNLLISISEKNLLLTKKLHHIGKKTIRDKLLAYLSGESLRAQCNSFKIPFDRQELADYLFVDRSALSNEISKLKREGILKNKKNEFELLDSFERYS